MGGLWRLTDGFAGSGVLVDVKTSLAVGAAHVLAGEAEALGVVDEAIEDGVGERRIANDVAPLRCAWVRTWSPHSSRMSRWVLGMVLRRRA